MKNIDHRPDCQLLTVPTYGLCTCDFDQRMRLHKRFKDRAMPPLRPDDIAPPHLD